jgi:hypothetical protein
LQRWKVTGPPLRRCELPDRLFTARLAAAGIDASGIEASGINERHRGIGHRRTAHQASRRSSTSAAGIDASGIDLRAGDLLLNHFHFSIACSERDLLFFQGSIKAVIYFDCFIHMLQFSGIARPPHFLIYCNLSFRTD